MTRSPPPNCSARAKYPLPTRREFLKLGTTTLGMMALGGLVPTILPSRLLGSIQASSESSPILVLVQLVGGNDGLNTVIPYQDDNYYRLRPTIAINEGDVLKLSDSLGLHPACNGLASLYNGGRLAIIQGVGYPNPNRSHFGSETIWATGGDSENSLSTGWLGRYFDQSTHAVTLNPEPVAVHFSRQTPLCLAGPDDHLIHGFEQPAEDLPPYFSTLNEVVELYRPAVHYPNTRFGQNLRKIAAMIAAQRMVQVYHVSLGGFDTHHLQSIPHHSLLATLSDGLAAFQEDLRLHRRDRAVLTMAFSEFGRRCGENERRGTDHGTAAPVFLMGANVSGGIHGENPLLPEDPHQDIRHEIDFRAVYATLLENWLGVPADAVMAKAPASLTFV